MNKITQNGLLKIGEAAKLLGVSIQTLRRWDEAGKLKPIVSPGGTRLYAREALAKINPVVFPEFKNATSDLKQIFTKPDLPDIPIEPNPPILSSKPSFPKRSFFHFVPMALAAFILTVCAVVNIYISSYQKKGLENVGQYAGTLGSTASLFAGVLADTTAKNYVEINADLTVNGKINGLILKGTNDTASLTVTGPVVLNQDLSTTSSPTFAALTLTASTNQFSLSDGKKLTLPDATTTLVGTDTNQIITNKTMSGSSNTFSNIPNSALSNSKVTVTAGSNLSGGGDVSLGSSVTLDLKSDLAVSTLTTSGNASVSSLFVTKLATFSGTIASDFLPETDNTYNLGSTTKAWKNIYAYNLLPGGGGTGTFGWWQRNTGAIAPTNITDDFLLGGAATTSAKFQVFGLTGNATTSGNLTFSNNGVIAGVAKQSLTLGDANTGNIQFYGTSNYVTPTGNLVVAGTLNGLTVSGGIISSGTWHGSAIGTQYGGTGQDWSAVAQGNIPYFSAAGTMNTLAPSTIHRVLTSGGTGANPSWDDLVNLLTPGTDITLGGTNIVTINNSSTLQSVTGRGASTTNPITVNSSADGTVVLGAASSAILNATSTTKGLLTPRMTTTQRDAISTPATGLLIYNTTTNQFNVYNGTSWGSIGSASGGDASWNNLGGVLSPVSLTADLAIGGTSTASAKFSFSNVAFGVPTASIGGTLSLNANGLIATTNKQTLTIGDTNTGNIAIANPITTGVWNATAIGSIYGGTGQNTVTTGDLLYGSASNTWGKLADVATGNVLISGGVGVAPSWGKVTLGTHTTGNYVSTLTGTANQVTVSASTGDVTLSLPSDLRAPGTLTLQGVAPIGLLTLSGKITGKANTIINETGDQSPFTASVSGTTKFVINNSGYMGIGTGANNNTLLATVDLRSLLGTQPVASISGATSMASLVVDNSGVGDIFTASSSGLNRFVITQNGNVGIGTTSPSMALDVSGNATVSGTFGVGVNTKIIGDLSVGNNLTTAGFKLTALPTSGYVLVSDANGKGTWQSITGGAGGIGGSGTLNTIAKFTPSGTSIGNSNITDTGSLVSISGNATASGNFGVGGELNTNAFKLTTAPAAGYVLVSDANGKGTWQSITGGAGGVTGTGTQNYLTKWNNAGGTSIGNTLVFDTGTAVGVGTTSPSSLLSIGANSDVRINGTGDVTARTFNGNVIATGTGTLKLGANTLDIGTGGTLGSAAFTASSAYEVPLTFNNGLTRSVNTITLGGALTQATTISANGGALLLNNSGTLPMASISGKTSFSTLIVDNTIGDLFTASSSGLNRFVIQNNGNVGIGTTSPGTSLQVVSPATLDDNNGILKLQARTSTGGDYAGLTFWGRPSGAAANARNWQISNNYNASGNLDILRSTTNTGNPTTPVMSIDMSGNVGIGTTAPAATFDVRGMSGTLPVASISGNTSFASMIVNNDSTVGDIFTASASGLPRFTIANNGNLTIGGNLIPATTNTFDLGTLTNQWRNLYISGNIYGTANGTLGYWQRLSGVVGPFNITDDVIVGGSMATGSAKFQIFGLTGNATTSGNLTFSNNGVIAGTAKQSLQLGDVNTGNIQFYGTSNYITPTGNLTLAGTLNGLTVSSGTISTGTWNAAAIGTQYGGTGNDWHLTAQGSIPYFSGTGTLSPLAPGTLNQVLTTNGASANPVWTNMASLVSQTGNISITGTQTLSVNTVMNPNFTTSVQTPTLGLGTGTFLATLDVRGNSGITPVASISGNTSFAAMVVDNKGSGDIFTASVSGLSKFIITNAGNVQIANLSASSGVYTDASKNLTSTVPTTGVLDYWQRNGATLSQATLTDSIGIGTTSPLSTFDIRGNSGTISIASISGNTSFAGLVANNNSTVGDIFAASASGLNRFVIQNNGNVGIGTTSPGGKLDILVGAADATTNPLVIGKGTTNYLTVLNNGNVGIGGTASYTTQAKLQVADTFSVVNSTNQYANLFFVSQTANIGLAQVFDNSATARVSLNAGGNSYFTGGNVGIGTTGPLAKLDVNGTASISGALSLYGTPTIQSTANQTLTLGGNSTGNIQLTPNNTAVATINSSALNLATGKTYQINGTDVLSATTLGSGVTGSSLTSVGNLTGLTVSGNATISGTLGAGGNTTINADLAVKGNLNVLTGSAYQINGASVLNATTLGTGVTGSSLTSVGTIGTGVWQGTTVAVGYGGTGVTSLSDVLGTANQVNINNGTGRVIGGNVTMSLAPDLKLIGDVTAKTFNGNTIATGSGTLATLAGSETFTNKVSYNGLVITANTAVVTTGTWNATAIGTQYGGTGQNFSTGVTEYLPYFSNTGVMGTTNIAHFLSQGTGIGLSGTTAVTISNTGVLSLAGTANQIAADVSTGAVTLSVPSDFRAPGTVNAVSGLYTGATAGTQRIDTSGNLVNIGTASMSGALTLTTTPTIGTTSMQSLTLGTASTGNIVFATATASGSFGVGGNTTFTGKINSHLIPLVDNTFDLGSLTNQWRNLYVAGNIYGAANGTLGYWQRLTNVVSPYTIADDLAIGGVSTAAAKFQIFGTSGNATTSGNLTFSNNGVIAGVAKQSLQLGDANTGDLNFYSTSNKLTSAGSLTLAGSMVATGNLNSSAGALQTNGITRIDNSGNATFALTTTTDLRISGQASAPSSPVEGQVYYNSTNKEFYAYKNAQWTKITAAAAGSCPTGYVLVPGSATFGTSDFCVMKYAASQDSNKNPASVAGATPWVSVDWYEAKAACGRAGAHLITNAEWMTIARNIESTTINDIDAAAGVQMATGHSDNAPANALSESAGSDPVVTGCTLTLPLSDASNAYSAASCEQRGNGSGGSTDADKGYYGTGNQWSASGYSAGVSNKSQLRTAVLSNGQVIWDFAGNVWQWSDWQCTNGGPWYYTAAWLEWNNANLTGYDAYAGGSLTNISTNGAGQYYGCSASGNVAFRGGDWSTGAVAGPFTLDLYAAPSNVYTTVGFRCAK